MDFVNEKTFENPPICILVDNGSLNPEAVLALRRIADNLSRRARLPVFSVGLLHSDKVDPALLDGSPGQVLLELVNEHLAKGHRDFLILPFFLGPSRGITQWLPEKLLELRSRFSDLRVKVASCLMGGEGDGSSVLASVLCSRIREVIDLDNLSRPHVALVDHGTPVPEVSEVRETVAGLARALLGDEISGIVTCCMERRPDPEYDFNDPLLQDLLLSDSIPEADTVVALLFLAPGRHAGPGGDVDVICRNAILEKPGVRIYLTRPMGEHDQLLDLLEKRLRECLDADFLL